MVFNNFTAEFAEKGRGEKQNAHVHVQKYFVILS